MVVQNKITSSISLDKYILLNWLESEFGCEADIFCDGWGIIPVVALYSMNLWPRRRKVPYLFVVVLQRQHNVITITDISALAYLYCAGLLQLSNYAVIIL